MSSINPFLVSNEPKDPSEWNDKLIGRVVLDNDEVSSLTVDECVRKKDLPTPNRILPPNSMMTMDFRPDRLNINVDHTMRVTGVNYG